MTIPQHWQLPGALFSQTIEGLWTCDTLVFTACAAQPLLLRGARVTCQADSRTAQGFL